DFPEQPPASTGCRGRPNTTRQPRSRSPVASCRLLFDGPPSWACGSVHQEHVPNNNRGVSPIPVTVGPLVLEGHAGIDRGAGGLAFTTGGKPDPLEATGRWDGGVRAGGPGPPRCPLPRRPAVDAEPCGGRGRRPGSIPEGVPQLPPFQSRN